VRGTGIREGGRAAARLGAWVLALGLVAALGGCCALDDEDDDCCRCDGDRRYPGSRGENRVLPTAPWPR
jgi:hypothetical protein